MKRKDVERERLEVHAIIEERGDSLIFRLYEPLPAALLIKMANYAKKQGYNLWIPGMYENELTFHRDMTKPITAKNTEKSSTRVWHFKSLSS